MCTFSLDSAAKVVLVQVFHHKNVMPAHCNRGFHILFHSVLFLPDMTFTLKCWVWSHHLDKGTQAYWGQFPDHQAHTVFFVCQCHSPLFASFISSLLLVEPQKFVVQWWHHGEIPALFEAVTHDIATPVAVFYIISGSSSWIHLGVSKNTGTPKWMVYI